MMRYFALYDTFVGILAKIVRDLEWNTPELNCPFPCNGPSCAIRFRFYPHHVILIQNREIKTMQTKRHCILKPVSEKKKTSF